MGRVLHWLGGFLAAGVALTVGILLAVFATVAMATLAVVGMLFVFFTSVALRAQRRAVVRPTVIEARKVGHAWVAYGWDRHGR
jgi:hypothetical protein